MSFIWHTAVHWYKTEVKPLKQSNSKKGYDGREMKV